MNKHMINCYGFKGKLSDVNQMISQVQEFAQNHAVCLQVVDACYIYGQNHLRSAGMHAVRAYHDHRMSTNSLAMEALLYIAGERQISVAIEKIGVKEHTNQLAVLCLSSESIKDASGKLKDSELVDFFQTHGFEHDDSVLKGSEKTLDLFGISENQRKTVSKAKYEQLILEKVAQVDIIK